MRPHTALRAHPNVPGVTRHEDSYGQGSRDRPRHDQSAVAAWQGGEAAVIPDSAGSRATPPVYSAKRFTCRGFDEFHEEAEADGFYFVRDGQGTARFRVRDILRAPEGISALVLRKLADDAGNE